MAVDGNVPWSMGFASDAATGWTGSDFIQDLMLTQQGPQYVLDLISGNVAYNDASVMTAYETYQNGLPIQNTLSAAAMVPSIHPSWTPSTRSSRKTRKP